MRTTKTAMRHTRRRRTFGYHLGRVLAILVLMLVWALIVTAAGAFVFVIVGAAS